MRSDLCISTFYHDSAAALVRDGRIIAAAQESAWPGARIDAQILELKQEDIMKIGISLLGAMSHRTGVENVAFNLITQLGGMDGEDVSLQRVVSLAWQPCALFTSAATIFGIPSASSGMWTTMTCYSCTRTRNYFCSRR